MPSKISDEKIEKLLELYEEGFSSRQIGKLLKIGNRTAMRYVNIHGLKPMTLKERTLKVKREIIENLKIKEREIEKHKPTTELSSSRIYHFNEDIFEVIDSEEKSILVGFYIRRRMLS